MKLCNNCQEQFNVCDFCKHFNFNGEDRGSKHGPAYVDKGCCVVHFMRCDPGDSVCDWFECEFINRYGERENDNDAN